MQFRCKFKHRRLIRRPRFLVRVKNVSDLATFYVDFCILYSECPPYFDFRFVWPTDLESIPHASTPTSIIPTKFEVDRTIHCWDVTWPGDIDLWPFDLEQLPYMSGHVTNHATKFEDPTTIRSWVTSYNGFLWLSLKMPTRLLRMRRITRPVSRGSKTITFLESPMLICLYNMQLRWLYDESN